MACLECAACLESTNGLQWHTMENIKKDNRTRREAETEV